MPLTGDPKKDIPELIESGHPQKQAVAIALKEQRGDEDGGEGPPVTDQEGPLAEQFPAPVADAAPVAPQAGPRGRAAGILFQAKSDGELLFVHRGDGGDFPRHWAPPGGHQVEGEDLEQAARREAEEETGLKYDGPLTKLYDDGQFCTYLARVDAPFPVTVCPESTGFTWAHPDNAPSPLHPGVAPVLRVLAADTELAWAELMRDGILTSPQFFERSGAGVFLVALRITGTGVSYRSKLREHVYRDAENYLNPEFLARCNGLPVVLDHPETKVLNSKEFTDRVCGTIMLPYLKGDEVWGIARIYSAEAIAWIQAASIGDRPISTSPGVVFDGESENVKVTLENGSQLLIEGNPALIDHLAICELGVWDKGGPPAGVELSKPIEELAMADDDKVKKDEEVKKDDTAKKDDDTKKDDAEPMGKILAKLDAMASRMDSMEEKIADKHKADAKADDAKKDDAKKDDDKKSDEDDKKKDDDTKKDDAMQCDSAEYTDAQARADRFYGMLGTSAPRALPGETPIRYRQRLARGLQKHSAVFKEKDLSAFNDADMLAMAEKQIYADAESFSRSPQSVGDGLLREHRSTSAAGHQISTYSGDPFGWLSANMLERKIARGWGDALRKRVQ